MYTEGCNHQKLPGNCVMGDNEVGLDVSVINQYTSWHALTFKHYNSNGTLLCFQLQMFKYLVSKIHAHHLIDLVGVGGHHISNVMARTSKKL